MQKDIKSTTQMLSRNTVLNMCILSLRHSKAFCSSSSDAIFSNVMISPHSALLLLHTFNYRLQLINLDLQLLSALLPAGDKSHNHPVFSSDAVKEVDIL